MVLNTIRVEPCFVLLSHLCNRAFSAFQAYGQQYQQSYAPPAAAAPAGDANPWQAQQDGEVCAFSWHSGERRMPNILRFGDDEYTSAHIAQQKAEHNTSGLISGTHILLQHNNRSVAVGEA